MAASKSNTRLLSLILTGVLVRDSGGSVPELNSTIESDFDSRPS